MLPRSLFRRFAELGIASTAIVTLTLAGCGGGGGGTSASSGGGGGTTTTTTVIPYKGRFTSGTVTLFDANGNPVTLNAGGTINASGVASLTFPASVAYPLTVQVNGTYEDETNGFTPVSMGAGTFLRGLIPGAAQAASGVPVTVLTELARSQLPASGISPASAVAALQGVASGVLGLSYSQIMAPPVFDANGRTTDPNTIRLAALAHAIASQIIGTAELTQKLQTVAAQLGAGSAVNAVIPQSVFASAVAAMNSASGVLPASATPPSITLHTLPGSPINTLIQNSIPTCGAGQVLQVGASGLSCMAGGGNGNQATCQASGGMWDPFIGVCLNGGGGNTGGGAGGANAFPNETITLPTTSRNAITTPTIAATDLSTVVGTYTGSKASYETNVLISNYTTGTTLNSCSLSFAADRTVTLTSGVHTYTQAIDGTNNDSWSPSLTAGEVNTGDLHAGPQTPSAGVTEINITIGRGKVLSVTAEIVADPFTPFTPMTERLTCWMPINRTPGTAGAGWAQWLSYGSASDMPTTVTGTYAGSLVSANNVAAPPGSTCQLVIAADGTLTFSTTGATTDVSFSAQIAGDREDRVGYTDASNWNLRARDISNQIDGAYNVITLQNIAGTLMVTAGQGTVRPVTSSGYACTSVVKQ